MREEVGSSEQEASRNDSNVENLGFGPVFIWNFWGEGFAGRGEKQVEEYPRVIFTMPEDIFYKLHAKILALTPQLFVSQTNTLSQKILGSSAKKDNLTNNKTFIKNDRNKMTNKKGRDK